MNDSSEYYFGLKSTCSKCCIFCD